MKTQASLQSTNRDCLMQPLWFAIFLLVFAMLPGAIPACAEGRYITNNTPRYVSTGTKGGKEDTSKIIEISIWLQPHNRDVLDKMAQDLYDRSSPNYRHWLNNAEIAARFAPTPTDAKTVEGFVESKI